MRPRNLRRALRLLDPVEARIMREVWSGNIGTPFVASDVHARMPELAYPTVMTTVVRLAEKGLLDAERAPGQPAISYQAAGTPEDFLDRSSRERVDDLVRLYGDAAFSDRGSTGRPGPTRPTDWSRRSGCSRCYQFS